MNIHVIHQFDKEVTGRLRRIENLLGQLMESLMSTSDDLKAAQALTDGALAKLAADVAALVAKLAAIPAPGMTPEQQAALDDAVAHANAINASISGIDAAANPPTPAPVPPDAPPATPAP